MEDDTTFHKCYEEVSVWLDTMYQDRKIPSFEINRHTIARMHAFMKLNKEMDRLTKILTDDLSRKTQEYSAKASHMDQVLKSVGISTDCLSQSGLRNLKILSDLASCLKLKDSTYPSYVMGLVDILNVAEDSSFETKKQEISKLHLHGDIKRLTTENYNLKSILETFEQQMVTEHSVNEKRKKETQFLKGKAKEYKALISDIQDINIRNGVSEEIHHENLKQIHQGLSDIRGEINTLKCRLSNFHSLPPDMTLARVKIEEARQELHKLENDLYNDLELLNL